MPPVTIDLLEGRSAEQLDIDRDDGFVLVRILLARGRAAEVKQAFYRRLCDLLSERAGVRPENLAVSLIENEREDWSFGHGQASYLELPRERCR
jgi:4-oxalocrotonate tautomerase